MQKNNLNKTVLKILVTASTFPKAAVDSAPRFILDLCKAISELNESECVVLAPHSSGALTSETIEGIKVCRYRYMFPEALEKISGLGIIANLKRNKILWLIVPFFMTGQLYATLKYIRKNKPHIILANWIVPQGLIAILVKYLFSEVKIMIISHGGDAAFVQDKNLLRKIATWVINKSDCVIAVSSYIKDKIELLPAINKNITVIPMGIDPLKYNNCRKNRLHSTNKAAKSILFVGRLEAKKGIEYLIRCMPIVLTEHVDAVLTIVGDGTLKNKLIEISQKLGLSSNVIFAGAVDHEQVVGYYEKAMVLAAPSINTNDDVEGLPTVIVEAMAATVPVITTDAGGISDIIENEVTGIMVPQKSIDDLAIAINKLIVDNEMRIKLAYNAYNKLLGKLTYSVIGEKYQSLASTITNIKASYIPDNYNEH